MIAIAPPDISEVNNYTDWLDKNKFPYTILRPDSSPLNYKMLLLCGGRDINNKKISLRNILEKRWVSEAYSKIHILGICRGLELVNVYLGGTLKKIKNHIHENRTCFHNIKINNKIIKVNSHHYQGIDILGKGLISEAVSDDGIHELVRGDKSLFVQWHPEKTEMWNIEGERLVVSWIKKNVQLSDDINKERQVFDKIVNYLYVKGFTIVSRERVFKTIDTKCNNTMLDTIISKYPLKNVIDKHKKPAIKLLPNWKKYL